MVGFAGMARSYTGVCMQPRESVGAGHAREKNRFHGVRL